MKITVDVGKDFPEITGDNADRFAVELMKIEDSDYREVYLDFSSTRSISSMAMGSLLSAQQKLASQNRKICVVNPSENVRRLLKLVNMNELIDE